MRERVAIAVAFGALAAAGTGWLVLHREADWWAIRVNDRTIGSERVSLTRQGDGWRLSRTGFVVTPSGRQRSTIDVLVDPDGHVRGTDGFALEVLAPALANGESRTVNVLDLYAHVGHEMTVTRTGNLVRAEGDGVIVEVTLHDDRVVRMVRGPVEVVHTPMEPTVSAYDPSMFEHPARAIPDAGGVHHAVFRLDGAEVVIETPLAMELPAAETKRLRTWVDAVRGNGDCQVQARALVKLATDGGLRAELVEGWAYVDDGTPALQPHAWATVTLGTLRVAVDPALDQPVASALHLPANGGEAWFAGRRVELVDAR